MIDILKLAIALMVISLAAGLAIGVTNSRTKDKIAEQNELRLQSSLEMVFGNSVEIKEEQGDDDLPDLYWSAHSEDGLQGYAFEVASRGYAGEIRYIVGVDATGTITGITILEQSETPGLGSRIEEAASEDYIWTFLFSSSEKSKPWFTQQFEGLSLTKPIGIESSAGEWHTLDSEKRNKLNEQNKITAITGSTISTRAVINGLEQDVAPYIKALKGTN
ncbi:Electron transport complex protein RnfG [Chitinispirillum alkaliphilum]|nr:Electron transport complex protein RnfG [Chitinispirillum alkaliphilum]